MSALLEGTRWAAFAPWQLGALALCFLWSGFVRSGLGFGGAALTLPLLLLFVDDPLAFLPAICWHLLLFSLLTVATRLGNVAWRWLGALALRLALPFAAGLAGLLSLPPAVLSAFVYTVTLGYALLYLSGRELASGGRLGDALCIAVGGYVSGVSLTGAPLIVAVGVRQLPPARLRDTLFVMWMILVTFKLLTFVAADVDLGVALALSTLPFVAAGHLLGLRLHARLVADARTDTDTDAGGARVGAPSGGARRFRRVLGAALALVSVVGLVTVLR